MTREARELQELADAIASAPEVEAIDLVDAVRRVVDEQAARPRRRRGVAYAAALAVAAAAAAVMVAATGAPEPAGDAVRRKSAGAGAGADRWVGIHAWRVGAGGGAPQPVDDALAAGDRLAFAYTNLGPEPFDYLLVFGVDATGRVYWFHPAYERAGDDPAAVPIERGAARVELPELVRHDYALGPLAIHAVFAREPVRVSEIEARVRDAVAAGGWDARAPARLAGARAAQHVVVVEVGR